MIKYATALRLDTAETEAILRRFTRANVQHPTYKALAELGRAVKTVFLCRYLHSRSQHAGAAPAVERHAMGVHLVKKTGNPRTAQRQLDHKNPSTTMQYMQFTRKEM